MNAARVVISQFGRKSSLMKLGYYIPEFPFRQGAAAGPYPMFVGARRPRVPCVMMAPQRTGCACHASHGKCHCKPHQMRRRWRGGLHGLGDSSAGLPAGSYLVYNASWQNSVLSKLSTAGTAGNSNWVATAATAALGSFGITVDNTTPTGNVSGLLSGTSGFTLNIHTSVDYNQAADVKSIIDHQVYLSLGIMPQSSIALASVASPVPNSALNNTPPGTPGSPNLTAAAQDWSNYQTAIASGDATGAAQWYAQYQVDSGAATPNSTLSWLENNAPMVALGVIGLALIWRIA